MAATTAPKRTVPEAILKKRKTQEKVKADAIAKQAETKKVTNYIL